MGAKDILARILRRFVGGAGPQLPEGIKIGADVFIGDEVYLDWSHGKHITIEDGATVANGARILCHDASSARRIHATWVAPVTIGRRAFVGADSLIMPGVTIGADSIVAAGAVVTCDVAAGTVVAGVPARPVGTVSDLDARRLRDMRERPSFAAGTHHGASLTPERQRELDVAAEAGGYFLRSSKADDVIDENGAA